MNQPKHNADMSGPLRVGTASAFRFSHLSFFAPLWLNRIFGQGEAVFVSVS